MSGHAKLETILRIGQVVAAKFRVDRLIAKGGMTAIWAGVNQHTGKRVVLKVILRSFSSNGDAVELFRREGLAASKVNHPNVVSIFDVIDHERATIIVMEVLDGETLGSYLARNGPLTLERALVLLLPAMRGVAAANAQGVVHRDLKPANLFLCGGADGQWITTKVLDFGASVIMRHVGGKAPVTDPLAMFGTPAYMAPEAIVFSPAIDARADVYGFGVLFFEALAGKLPFPGPPGLDLLRRIQADPPPKVTLYRPDLSSDVVKMIDLALAKNPNDRFPDMEHFIRTAESLLLAFLPTQRAQIPISGLSSTPPVGAKSEAAIPMAYTAQDKEPSSRAQLGETRKLCSPAGEPLPGTDGPEAAPKMRLSPTDTVTRTRRGQIRGPTSSRLLNRRTPLGAGIVAFLIVVTWVAAPASSSDSAAGPGQSSISSRNAAPVPGPMVTPLASEPSPPMPTTPTRETQRFDRLAMAAAEPSLRAAAAPPSKRLARRRSARRPSRTADVPNQPFAASAGRLSAFDF